MKKIIPPLFSFAGCLVFFEILIRFGKIPNYLLPAPSEVAQSLWFDRGELFSALWSTLTCASLGLLLSVVIGFFIAFLLSISDFAYRAFYPYAVFFQTVPIIAISPLLVVWFGFAEPTVIASAFIVSVFPIIANSLVGLRSTDPSLVELHQLYSKSSWSLLVKVRLPYALPVLFSGLRIAAGLAVIGAIVGEFVGGGGLGSVIDGARGQQRVDRVFAAVLASSAIGFLLVGGISLISFISLRRWHVSETSDKTQA